MILRPTATRRQRAGMLIAAALVVAVGWGVQRFVGWTEIARLAAVVPATTWLGFAAWLAASYATRVVRLWRLLRDIQVDARLAATVPVFFVHNALATLLPARLGEAAMPMLARRWIGTDWAAAIGALAWWRIADMAVVSALALVLLASGATVLAPLYALAFVACALPFGMFAVRGSLLRVARRDAGPDEPRWKALLHRMLGGMPAHARALAADLGLAFVAWSTKLVAFTTLIVGVLSGLASAVSVPVAHVAAAGLAGDAAGALPVPTIGGVGTFEAGIVLGLGALGVRFSDALAIGVLLHGAVLASIVLTGLVGLAVGLSKERTRAEPLHTNGTALDHDPPRDAV